MTTASASTNVRRARSAANKYLTLQLANEHYGIPILKVQEIIGLQDITPVPRMPSEVRGVINLRGKVIPVIDLRTKFGMMSASDTKRTSIVVVQVSNTDAKAGPVVMGLVVDQVSEVQDILPEQIEAPPGFGPGVDTSAVSGFGKTGKKVVLLLDIDRLLGSDALALSLPSL